jgi:hypothetical protein
MKAHWVIPAGVPGGALTQMSFEIAADGRVYDATVKTPSGSTDLDRSCLDALNQVEQMGADRPGARSGFRLSCDEIKLNHLRGLFDERHLPLLLQRHNPGCDHGSKAHLTPLPVGETSGNVQPAFLAMP